MSDSRYRNLENPETLRAFVRNLREGIYITSREGKLLDANPAALELFGAASVEELRSIRASDLLVNPELRAEELELLDRYGEVREFEIQIKRADGEVRTLLDSCHAVEDDATGEVVYHGILIDITQRKGLEDQLREYSVRDPLTGCYNRRYLDQEKDRLQREESTWGAIVVDIDHFKEYNDRHGHQTGDEVLVKVSRFLMRHVRAEDPVVRIGGDEFLTLLLGERGRTTVEAVERIRSVVEAEAPVPLSFGWALRENEESLYETIGRADQSLIRVRIAERGERRWAVARRGTKKVGG